MLDWRVMIDVENAIDLVSAGDVTPALGTIHIEIAGDDEAVMFLLEELGAEDLPMSDRSNWDHQINDTDRV